MTAATATNGHGRRDFDKALFSHIGYTISNAVRAFMLAVSGGLATSIPVRGPTARYFRQLTRMSAAFALIADSVLVTLGGRFKFKETLSGRLADALIHLYMGSAVLKQFEDDGRPEQDFALLQWAMDDCLYTIQSSLRGVLENFPVPLLGGVIHLIAFPLGHSYKRPPDHVGKKIARLLMSENTARDRLIDGVYFSDENDASGKVNTAFHLVLDSAKAEQAIRTALQETVTVDNYVELVKRAVESGVITEEQATRVRLAQEATARVIAVDDFPRSKIEGEKEAMFQPAAANSGQAD